jgi:hypothetical protein
MCLFWIVNQSKNIPDIPFDTFGKAEIVARAYVRAEPTQRVTINHGGEILASINTSNDGRVWVNMMPGAELFA